MSVVTAQSLNASVPFSAAVVCIACLDSNTNSPPCNPNILPASAEMEQQFADRILHYASPYGVFADRDILKMAALTEGLKDVLSTQCAEFVHAHRDDAMLRMYFSDETRLKIPYRTHVAKPGSSGTLTRHGREVLQLLVQVCIFKKISPTGVPSLCLLTREPLPLTCGKKAWNLYQACEQFGSSLASLAHEGISISVFVFDRGAIGGLGRHILEKHESESARMAKGTSLPAALAPYRRWAVVLGCCHHDLHNGLKWGLANLTAESQTLTDLHVAIESLRDSLARIHNALSCFLIQHVSFAAPLATREKDMFQMFWLALDLESSIVDILVAWEVRWCAHTCKLLVSSDLEQQFSEEGWDQLAATVAHVLKFSVFSESRWLSIGVSSRQFLAALAVGLDSLVAVAKTMPHVSQFSFAGWSHMSGNVKKLACVSAFVGHVADTPLSELMRDDRLAKQWTLIRDMMHEEIALLESYDTAMWDYVVSLVDVKTQMDLRSDVLTASMVCLAYVDQKMFSIFRKYPFCLFSGSLEANFDALCALVEPPKERVASQIWHLNRLGATPFHPMGTS